MSYRGPKAKLSRRLGVALTDKASRVMVRKPNPPGQHGGRRRRSLSEYGKQLLEKQKLRFQYNVSEKQLRKYYKRANKSKNVTPLELVRLLEMRLDNVIYRAGFAPTIYAARQLVNHGHVLVDGKKVDIPSYEINLNDVVSIKEKSRTIPIIVDAVNNSQALPYIERDNTEFTAKVTRTPQSEEIPVTCEPQLVVELYSR